jgi:hypothetical protein
MKAGACHVSLGLASQGTIQPPGQAVSSEVIVELCYSGRYLFTQLLTELTVRFECRFGNQS